MGTCRVVKGQQSDGTFGLRISLPGYDALTDDAEDSDKFSFNSGWLAPHNLVRTHIIGTSSPGATVYFADLGYIPHMEIRQAVGGTVYDDRPHLIQTSSGGSVPYTINNWSHGLAVNVKSNQFSVNARESGNVFYIVFKEAS